MEYGISLGSNLGDRAAHLGRARDVIASTADAELLAQSSIYETEPVDVAPEYQDLKFYNSVIIIASDESPQDWLAWLNQIETDLGRLRGPDKNAPRTIDADILYAGQQCIDSGGLTVPHPRWAQRRFVVEPLAEVRGDLILPGWEQSVADVLQTIDDQITKLELCW